MPRRLAILATALILAPVGPLAAQSPAQRPPQSATVLAGLQRLDVMVTVSPDCGVTDDALLADTRLAVRRTGLAVDDTASAFLAFGVKCATDLSKPVIAIAVHTLVVELVTVPRLNLTKPDVGAAVWQHGAALLANDALSARRQIRQGIAEAIERLERDWKTANAGRRP
jgi:hypothetical protein